MKRFAVALIALAVFGLAPAAQAASVTLDLNCLWSGGSCGYNSASYGTITLADNGNVVNVTVAVNSPLQDVLNVYLNWTGTVQNGYSWYLQDGAGSGVSYSQNAEGPDGKLDINIDTGYFTSYNSPWTGTLELRHYTYGHYDYQNLDASQFDVKDVNGYWAFADVASGQPITVGAEDYTPAPPSEVPEPASLTLLGTGLFGLASAMRRRTQKSHVGSL